MTTEAPIKPSDAHASEITYYFWLYDRKATTIDVLTRVQPEFALCEVRGDKLSIVTTDAHFSTSLTDIKEIRLWRWASAGAKVTINVEIDFVHQKSLPGREKLTPVLYLAPMDVYTFDTGLKESEDLVSVINVLKFRNSDYVNTALATTKSTG